MSNYYIIIMSNNLTQMDLGRWFRNIEYLFGIANTLSDRQSAHNMVKCLLRSSMCFDNMVSNYLVNTPSIDVEVMLNRNRTIITSMISKLEDIKSYQTNTEEKYNITFFELERWKRDLMCKTGIMLSMDHSEHRNNFAMHIKKSIKLLSLYVIAYGKRLNKTNDNSSQKASDLITIIKQLINLYKSISACQKQ
jgi:hypothetical protein